MYPNPRVPNSAASPKKPGSEVRSQAACISQTRVMSTCTGSAVLVAHDTQLGGNRGRWLLKGRRLSDRLPTMPTNSRPDSHLMRGGASLEGSCPHLPTPKT
jgi:hypothetical protein